MSEHSGERLGNEYIASFDVHGTIIDVDRAYLLTCEGKLVDDAGGVRIGLSNEKDMICAVPSPEEALRIADSIRDAAHAAIAARKPGVVPDGVPSEWTGEAGPV